MSNILGKGILFTTPPTLPTKNKGQEYSYKNLYIYQGKKDGYIWGKTVFLTTPPYVSQNIAHDLFAYGLFFDGGSGNPTIILTYPPHQLNSKGEISLINNNEQVLHSYILNSKQQD